MMCTILIVVTAVVCWVFLPAPKPVHDFFVRIGWAKPAASPDAS